MAGNAHAWRHRHGLGKPCPTGCVYCAMRPKSGEPGSRVRHYINKTSKGRHVPHGRNAQKRG